MNQTMQMSKQELANSAGNFAGSLMRDGYSPDEIIAALLEEGLSQNDAVAVVQQLLKLRADSIRQQAQSYRTRVAIYFIASIFLGMFLNSFVVFGLGYLLMLLGFGFGAREINTYIKAMQQADKIQTNWASHQ